MKPVIYIFALLLYVTKLPAQKVHVTLVRNELIMQSPPFAACHASTITELAGKRLMAAWFGGSGEGAPDVCIYTAVYENGQWGPPLRLADGVVNDTLRYPC